MHYVGYLLRVLLHKLSGLGHNWTMRTLTVRACSSVTTVDALLRAEAFHIIEIVLTPRIRYFEIEIVLAAAARVEDQDVRRFQILMPAASKVSGKMGWFLIIKTLPEESRKGSLSVKI